MDSVDPWTDSKTIVELQGEQNQSWYADDLQINTGVTEGTGPTTEDVRTQVVDQNGDPVSNATVVSVGFDAKNFTGSKRQTQQQIEDINKRLNDVEPGNWTQQIEGDFSITGSDGVLQSNAKGVAVHSGAEWQRGDLSSPGIQFEPGTNLVFSMWSDDCGGFTGALVQDDYDSDLAGVCIQDDTDVVVERITMEGSVQERSVKETTTYQEFILTNEHEVAIQRGGLTPGFYRVYPKGSPQASYLITVGDPQSVIDGWKQRLEDRKGQLTERAKTLQELSDAGKIETVRTKTGPDGRVNLSFASNVAGVKLMAYKTPPSLGPNATEADLRDYYDQFDIPEDANASEVNLSAYAGAVYLSNPQQSPYIQPAKTDSATVGVYKAEYSNFMNMNATEAFAEWLEDYAAGRSFSFAGHNYSLSNVTDLLDARDTFAGMVEATPNATARFCGQHSEWCDSTNESLAFEEIDADNITKPEAKRLIRQVGALTAVLRNTPTELDAGDVTTEISERARVLTDDFRLPAPPGSLDAVNATIIFGDGTREQIPSEHLQLESLQPNGPLTVLHVSKYPLTDSTDASSGTDGGGREIRRIAISLADAEVPDVETNVDAETAQLRKNLSLPAVPDSLRDVTATVEFDDGTTSTLSNDAVSLARSHVNGPRNVLRINYSVPAGQTVTGVNATLEATTGEAVNTSFEATRYLDRAIPFDAPGDLSFADFNASDVEVIMHSQSGSTTSLDSDYWRVEQATLGLGNPAIVIEDYPLESDVAVKRVEVIVAGEAGIGRITSRITNPGFAGTLPELESMDVNTLYPGPETRVTIDAEPTDAANFGGVANATVRGPDGARVNASVSNGTVAFTTAGAGSYRVEVRYTNPSGKVFASVFEVDAATKSIDGPATLIARPGTNSLYALAGDDLQSGSFTKEGVNGLVAAAVISADGDAPSELQVHATDLDAAASGDTTVRVLRGSERQNVRSHVQFTLHTQALPEDAHVYVGECPVPKSGNSCGDWGVNGTTSTIEGVTTASGERVVTVVRDPGWSEEIRWEFRQLSHSLDLDIPLLVTTPVPFLGVGLVLRRRTRTGTSED
ncbi:hypothetical protein [Halorubellus sp. PRR65]|uniref:hypothetical protein n=1 Tax=Halorubellus sp. PRR65 TaxID=3098148 RepID=UPI002B2593D3|nr:hypothetical protein [Halorubellus sp. PRR65]